MLWKGLRRVTYASVLSTGQFCFTVIRPLRLTENVLALQNFVG